MISRKSDTIFALATGLCKSAIAIVRISGPECKNILKQLCRREAWTEREAVYSVIRDNNGIIIDKGIVIFFKSPRSFTGEDMAELQIVGGRALKGALLRTLDAFSNTRQAEAGEFARRAFENGKMDLAEVEGLASIVDAETTMELRHSALMAFGSLSNACEQVRGTLLKASSLVEGMLDFSDVEDPAETTAASVRLILFEARDQLLNLRSKGLVSERLREGYTVAVVGEPNVGKSTLINFILKRDAVIVSEFPGTTRDYLEFFVELSGYPVVFVDTAGVRSTSDPIEQRGIERSLERVRAADLILWLSDNNHEIGAFLPSDVPVVKVRSKCDENDISLPVDSEIQISAQTGLGIDLLVHEIISRASAFFADAGSIGLGSERQRTAVDLALKHLDRALAETHIFDELIAEEIRGALSAVGRITRRVDAEQVLDEVFSRLCVGK